MWIYVSVFVHIYNNNIYIYIYIYIYISVRIFFYCTIINQVFNYLICIYVFSFNYCCQNRSYSSLIGMFFSLFQTTSIQYILWGILNYGDIQPWDIQATLYFCNRQYANYHYINSNYNWGNTAKEVDYIIVINLQTAIKLFNSYWIFED